MLENEDLSESSGDDVVADDAKNAKPRYLSLRPIGVSYDLGEVRRAFEEMHEELGRPCAPEEFANVGTGSGTHLLKLASARAASTQCIIRSDRLRPVSPDHLCVSVNARQIPIVKIAYRPIEVRDNAPQSVVGHILAPTGISDAVLEAFSDVFGQACLDALKNEIMADLPYIESLPSGEFPVIFLPNPLDPTTDIQATPISPAAAMRAMRDVKNDFIQKASTLKKSGGRPVYLRTSKQVLSSKPQNISPMVAGERHRLLASFPSVLHREDAEVYRYAMGGRFPYFRDEDALELTLRYARLISQDEDYSNPDIRAGLDRRADKLIEIARAFIRPTMTLAMDIAGEGVTLAPPSEASVLMPYKKALNEEDFALVRKALQGSHFARRAEEKGDF